MNNDNAIHPLNPADRNPHVDYLGHAVSPEEFEGEDTRILCEGCGQVEVKAEGDYCPECLVCRAEYAAELRKAS